MASNPPAKLSPQNMWIRNTTDLRTQIPDLEVGMEHFAICGVIGRWELLYKPVSNKVVELELSFYLYNLMKGEARGSIKV